MDTPVGVLSRFILCLVGHCTHSFAEDRKKKIPRGPTAWAILALRGQPSFLVTPHEKSDPFRDRYKEAREGGKSLGKAMQDAVPYGTPKEKSRILEEGCNIGSFYGLFCCPSMCTFLSKMADRLSTCSRNPQLAEIAYVRQAALNFSTAPGTLTASQAAGMRYSDANLKQDAAYFGSGSAPRLPSVY